MTSSADENCHWRKMKWFLKRSSSLLGATERKWQLGDSFDEMFSRCDVAATTEYCYFRPAHNILPWVWARGRSLWSLSKLLSCASSWKNTSSSFMVSRSVVSSTVDRVIRTMGSVDVSLWWCNVGFRGVSLGFESFSRTREFVGG